MICKILFRIELKITFKMNINIPYDAWMLWKLFASADITLFIHNSIR